GPVVISVAALLGVAALTDWRTGIFAALLIFGVAQAALSRSKMLMAELLVSIVPILVLIVGVLVSIFQGVATPSESGAVGVFGALILAALNYLFDRVLARDGAGHITPRWKLTRATAVDAARSTANITILVMTLLFASLFFRLMFQELGGSEQVAAWLSSIPGGKFGFVVIAMIAVFLLGINLEFLEITFIVVPIFVPAMAALEFTNQEIVWFAVLMAVNLNMAFISPPVGFSLFYLQSVAPDEVKTADIHKGALPFMGLQIVALVVLAVFPGITNFSYCFFNPNAPEQFCDPNSTAGSNLFTVLAVIALVTLVATIVMSFRQRQQGPPAVEEAAAAV
ncbi:MAG: TRAP transporter large permease subunit, partial [Actinomycetota bacterium]